MGGSKTLAVFRRAHGFGRTKTFDEIATGRLKTIRWGRRHHVTDEQERAYIELLEEEAQQHLVRRRLDQSGEV